jgi:hypothetical protein
MEFDLKAGLLIFLSIIVIMNVSGIVNSLSVKMTADQIASLNDTTDADAIEILETNLASQKEGAEAQGNYASIVYMVLTITAIVFVTKLF